MDNTNNTFILYFHKYTFKFKKYADYFYLNKIKNEKKYNLLVCISIYFRIYKSY